MCNHYPLHQCHQVKNSTIGVVAPTIDMYSLVHMETPYPLDKPIVEVVMNPKQDVPNNGGCRLC